MADHMLCVVSRPTFAYYSSAFGDNAERFCYLLFEMAIMELIVMSSVWFIQAMEHGAAEFVSAGLPLSVA